MYMLDGNKKGLLMQVLLHMMFIDMYLLQVACQHLIMITILGVALHLFQCQTVHGMLIIEYKKWVTQVHLLVIIETLVNGDLIMLPMGDQI